MCSGPQPNTQLRIIKNVAGWGRFPAGIVEANNLPAHRSERSHIVRFVVAAFLARANQGLRMTTGRQNEKKRCGKSEHAKSVVRQNPVHISKPRAPGVTPWVSAYIPAAPTDEQPRYL